MKTSFHVLALAAAAAVAAPAQAVVVSGTTAGAPTFNRPFTLADLSFVGTAVRYTALPFTVATSGSYAFLSTATGSWDNFTLLYTPSFAPGAALDNLVALNDDLLGSSTSSGFSSTLTAGVNYVFVTTGYENFDFGAYTTSITGPGDVILAAVPEPGTYGLMALGAVAVLLAARRRRETLGA